MVSVLSPGSQAVTSDGHFNGPQYQVRHRILALYSGWEVEALKFENHYYQTGSRVSRLKSLKFDCSKQCS
jgi:hypothetical protein